jgi:hypothetical protein
LGPFEVRGGEGRKRLQSAAHLAERWRGSYPRCDRLRRLITILASSGDRNVIGW